MSASLTDTGVVIDTQASSFESLQLRVRELFDSDLVITQSSDLGKILVIFSEANVSNQQFISTLTQALSVDDATGQLLINLGTLNGAGPPNPASRSTAPVQLGGDGGLDLSDKRVQYQPTGSLWRIPLNTQIAASGTVDVEVEAEETGPTQGFAGDADWIIVDGVTGWDSVAATGDATLGEDAETQEAYRIRVKGAGSSNGKATEPAVKQRLGQVSNKFRLNNNRSPVPDADGVPGFTVEAVFASGEPTTIGLALLESLGLTTPTFGSESVVVIDVTDGEAVEFFFSYFSSVRVIHRITVDTTGAEKPLPVGAANTVVSAVVAYTDSLAEGGNVVPAVAAAEALAALPPGTAVGATGEAARFGGTLSPATVAIASREEPVSFGEPQVAELVAAVGPYNLTAGTQLDIAVDGGTVVSTVFSAADFALISAATPAEVAAVVQAALTALASAGTATSAEERFVVRSTATGDAATVDVRNTTSPSVLIALSIAVGITTGTNTDVEVVFV